jgi:YebC/PmpR family DNA-binding regulatory protein
VTLRLGLCVSGLDSAANPAYIGVTPNTLKHEAAMAGHSQFKNIMHRKGRQDKIKSKIFGKMAREITVAAKAGGPDPDMNARLRLAIQLARAENMPRDNIERAVKKASGSEGEAYEAMRYEGYAAGGIAVIVETLTDNRNRTGGAVRALFTKHGGNLGSTGSVSHMFNHVGEIVYQPNVGSVDAVLDAAIEAGADDCVSDASGHTVVCSFDSLGTVAAALEAKLGEATTTKVIWKPTLSTHVDEDGANSVMKLINALEEDDDVQTVFSNFEVDDATLARLVG